MQEMSIPLFKANADENNSMKQWQLGRFKMKNNNAT